MYELILPILYIFSGFFMKLSDDFYDEKNYNCIAIVLGIVCGIATAIASLLSVDAACIFIAILLGNIIALKVDGIHHVVTMLAFVIILSVFSFFTLFVCSISTITIIALVLCIIGAFVDELGNDNEKVYSWGRFFELFFEYRFTLKIVILVLALCGCFNIMSFVYFICFELAYECARIIFERFFL